MTDPNPFTEGAIAVLAGAALHRLMRTARGGMRDSGLIAAFGLALVATVASCDLVPRPDADPVWPASGSLTELRAGTLPDCLGEPPAWPGQDVSRLVVQGDSPLCSVEFEVVARLAGSQSGILPRPPVAAGPGGVLVTATYRPGVLAVWSPDGAFIRSFGRGEGSGPGEFSLPPELAVSPDSVVHVLTGLPRWHRYALDGDFLGTASLPSEVGPATARFVSDGRLVTIVPLPGLMEGRTFLWADGDVRSLDESPLGYMPTPLFDYSTVLGLWTTDYQRAELARHLLPEGVAVLRIGREGGWTVAGASDATPRRHFELALDDRGLLWYLVNVPARDAPSGEPPPMRSMDEIRTMARLYTDNIVEVVTIDGRLVASRRYEVPGEVPRPITAERWYRVEDDSLSSMVILEPVLVAP